MNKEIKHLVLEIFSIILLIILVVPIFVNASEDTKKVTQGMMASQDLTVDKTKNIDYNLYPLSDDYVLRKEEMNTLSVRSGTQKNKHYLLYLRVDRKSTIDKDDMKIRIDDQVYALPDIYESSDNQYDYYLIYTNSVKGTDTIDYLLFLDENASGYGGESFIFSFMIQEDVLAYQG